MVCRPKVQRCRASRLSKLEMWRPVYLIAAAATLFAGACGEQEPFFESVLSPSDTYDSVGPYRLEAIVNAPRQVERLTLQRNELLREIQELHDDPQAIRERARELGLGLPDETIILK